MPWLLDGNNLARGRDRALVRQAALAVARQEKVRILIFFDGAPPQGVGETEKLGSVEVRYVVHADTAILAFLRTSRRGWRLATDDRALGVAARAAGPEAGSRAPREGTRIGSHWRRQVLAAPHCGVEESPNSGWEHAG